MRRILHLAVCLCVMIALPLALFAEDFMAQGNSLYDKAKAGDYQAYKASGDAFAKALEAAPNSYEAAWKAARSYRNSPMNPRRRMLRTGRRHARSTASWA